MMIPRFLTHGDKVAIVSPSGNIAPEYVHKAVEVLRSWDLEPVVSPHALGQSGRYSGTKEDRTADLQWALDERDIRAIICSRGGYGAVQIVDQLDFTHFELNPKWLLGFSDITVFHWAVAAYEIASLHGIMAKDIAENTEMAGYVRKALFGELDRYSEEGHELNRPGKAAGLIIGGNLSVLCGLRGTHFDVDMTGRILFIEDVGEEPYRIDRFIHNLKLGGIFEDIAGLIVGRFSDYEEDPEMGASLYELIADAVADYEFPVAFGFPAGHVNRNLPLPFGVPAMLTVTRENTELKFRY
jgi:muramoyltetrapeptide carboxypeptidase